MSRSRDDITGERLKSLGVKGRIKWFISYYGLIVATVAAGLMILGYLAFSIFRNTPQPDLRIIVLDDHASFDNGCEIKDGLAECFEGEVEISCYLKSDPTNMQAFLVRLTADDIDLLVVPADFLATMQENDFVRAYAMLPSVGNYSRATVTDEGADALAEDMFLVEPNNHEPEHPDLAEAARDYLLN